MIDEIPFERYQFEFTSPDANAPGGRRTRQIYSIPHVMARARELGVQGDIYKIFELDT